VTTVCAKCGGEVMPSYGGWTHKRTPEKRHVVAEVKEAEQEDTEDSK
jgi:hypothetical protein